MKMKKKLKDKGRQVLLVLLEFLWKWVIRFFFKPDFIFLVYGDERHKRACWSERRERKIGLVGLIGFIRTKKNKRVLRGLNIASTVSREEFDAKPSRALEVVDEVKRCFPGVKAVALAGQLSGWIFRASGQAPSKPCVGGTRGACFAVSEGVREIISSRFAEEKNLCVAVVGGAGHTGSEVVKVLAADSRWGVIALDSRLPEDITRKIQRTSNPEYLSEASVVVALTPKGDDIKEVARYIRSGAVVIDDTHPMIGQEARDSLGAQDVTLFKVTVADGSLIMWPRLPDFNPRDIPGCLLEALVVSILGHEMLADQTMFDWAAKGSGFAVQLGSHLEY